MENRRDPEAVRPEGGTVADAPRVAVSRREVGAQGGFGTESAQAGGVGPGRAGPEGTASDSFGRDSAGLMAEIREL